MTHCSKFIFVLGLGFCGSVSGQQTGKIETDRPVQCETPYTVPKKWFQSEIGFKREETRNGFPTYFHPTMLTKYGVSNRFELRLITEYVSVETPLIIPDGSEVRSGLRPIILGGKVALFEEKGLRPKTSVLFHTSIPKAAYKNFRQSHIAPSVRLVMQHTLTPKINLGYNIGADWNGENGSPGWFIGLTSSIELGKRWKAYAEIYNILKDGEHPLNIVDGGIVYNISNNFQIDISYGYGLNPHAYFGDYFALGFSFRVPTIKIPRS